MKVYVATSWRNEQQPYIVAMLRAEGHDVYDFRESPGAFNWEQVDPSWRTWTPGQMIDAFYQPMPDQAFMADMTALRDCQVLVLLMPCGRDAHSEFGWAAGAGKRTVILLSEGEPPSLMHRMADRLVKSRSELLEVLRGWEVDHG